MNNVLFIPGVRRNLISVSKLLDEDFSNSFNNNLVIISINGLTICTENSEETMKRLSRQ